MASTRLRRRSLLMACLGLCARPAWAKPETGPNGGPLMRVGSYTAELSVWEERILVWLYDEVGRDVVPPKSLLAKITVKRLAPPPPKGTAPRVMPLVRERDRLRASVPMTGVDEAEITIEIELEKRRFAGTHVWRRAEDRSRLDDGFKL